MKNLSILYIFLFCFILGLNAQDKKGYLVKSTGDTVAIEKYVADRGLIYYKPIGAKKEMHLEPKEVSSVFFDGHQYAFVNNTTNGKGLLVWSEIKAVNAKYIFAMSNNFNDIYNVYIVDRNTGNLVADYIITDSRKKREGAKQMVLTYFDDCNELKQKIAKNERFPDGEIRFGGITICK